jgi:hypothetical protein
MEEYLRTDNLVTGQEIIDYIRTRGMEESGIVVAFKMSEDGGTYLSGITSLCTNGLSLQLNEEMFDYSLDEIPPLSNLGER